MSKAHLDQAYLYWKALLKPTDQVIDATCGNGKDSLKLAELVPQGHVYAIDIQEVALKKAQQLIPHSNISYHLQSHTQLPDAKGVKLVVYNLGYLPGGDKRITTKAETTLESVKKAAELIEVGGALSITCYPHEEGKIEENILHCWVQKLDPEKWHVTHHSWQDNAPSLYFIYKLKN